VFFFFFSSRRRHTRWPRDWSSDVCSSDLFGFQGLGKDEPVQKKIRRRAGLVQIHITAATVVGGKVKNHVDAFDRRPRYARFAKRSEERRVGKECRDGR